MAELQVHHEICRQLRTQRNENVELDGEAYFEVAKKQEYPHSMYIQKTNKVKSCRNEFQMFVPIVGAMSSGTTLVEGVVDIYRPTAAR